MTVGKRLRTWLSGGKGRPVRAPQQAPASQGAVAAAEPAEAPAPAVRWSPEILDIAQRVWGTDFLGPTDEAYVRRILKPLAIDSSLSVLELGAGLGGGARVIARDYDAWVSAYEADPVLAEQGMSLSLRSGLAKKAPIHHFDPNQPDLRSRYFDRVVMRDVLGTVEDPLALLRTVQESMKPKAQLLITDFVLAERGASSAAVQAWMAIGPGSIRPIPASTLLGALKSLKLRVHVAEDQSRDVEQMITARWDQFRSTLKPTSLRPELLRPLMEEGSRWQACVQALASGGLRYYRIVAST